MNSKIDAGMISKYATNGGIKKSCLTFYPSGSQNDKQDGKTVTCWKGWPL